MLRAAQPHANTILACMANLCTSAPGEQKHAASLWVSTCLASTAEIEDLLYMDKIDSAGIQEGRLPSDATINGKRCVLDCAGGAGKKHHCGVLIWIAKDWAKAVQSVKVVSPRIIHVNVKLGDQLICAFSAHAPTEANEEGNLETLYEHLEVNLKATPAQCKRWLLGDFNTRLAPSLRTMSAGRITLDITSKLDSTIVHPDRQVIHTFKRPSLQLGNTPQDSDATLTTSLLMRPP